MFRPATPVNFTVTEQLNLGRTAASPTSLKLFLEWYAGASNSTASLIGTLCNWASFDVLEAALYLATNQNAQLASAQSPNIANNIIRKALLLLLSSMQLRTPIGRVAFDVNGVNTAMSSIAAQALPSSTTAEIVGPSDLATASVIYPMPSWDDRVYTWSLLGGTQKKLSMIVAAVCTAVLGLMAVTVIAHRNGKFQTF